MKIAVDIDGQFVKMTGIQQYVDSLLNALYALETPHEIVAFAPGVWSRAMWAQAERDGAFAWRANPKARVDTAGNDFALADWLAPRSPLRPAAARLDRRLIRSLKGRTSPARLRRARARYDLVHTPDPVYQNYADLGARRGIATIYDVTTITHPWTHAPGAVETWARFFDYARKHCARVLTISEHSKRDIVERLGIPEGRIDVTPLAARSATRRVEDPVEIAGALGPLGLVGAPFVLYAGTLEPRKNLRRLIEAFARAVTEEKMDDHRLALVGGCRGEHGDELRALARGLGVGARLVTPGYVSNAQMNALMSSCAAFAYVSEYEGFGMPPLEAMTCGAPVLAANTTSLPEVVGAAGLAVDPLDVGAISEALRVLLTDDKENARRRALSLERAGTFSWERTARLTLRSYEAAVA